MLLMKSVSVSGEYVHKYNSTSIWMHFSKYTVAKWMQKTSVAQIGVMGYARELLEFDRALIK